MTKRRYSFTKEERLKSKKEISRIFKDGIFLFQKHLSLVFIQSLDKHQVKHKIGISVPKKYFNSAVDRNRIKRQIREIFRLNREILSLHKQTNCFNIMFIYKSNKAMTFEELKKELISLCQLIDKEVNKDKRVS